MNDLIIKRTSTYFLQAVLLFIGIGIAGLLLWEPQVEGVNAHATNFEIYFQDAFLALAYIGSIPVFVAIYQAFKLLGYIRQNILFSQASIQALRTIKYCAIVVMGFVAVEEFFILLNHGNDDAAGGVFMGIIITFGSIIVVTAATLFAQIVKSVIEKKS